ncbi:uncharacterized protein DEA37_0006737, partial [Paragonimus westermani]
MDLPDHILERVFLYLSWNDRARAARVCRKWLGVFRSPLLWRRIVFTPPTRPLTRLQYDMRGYRTSCCLRAIGSYVREFRFLKSEDIFLLNRTLSLIAKYLETNPIQHRRSSKEVDIHTIATAGDYQRSAVDSTDDYTGNTDIDPVKSLASDAAEEPSILVDDSEDLTPKRDERFSDYISCITGDPDAEATLRLIMKLQERELHMSSSDTSSDE